MIRPIDIKINAAHPELPLAEASAYTGAPSTVLIRGVPGSCGKWAITAVQVCATFPDNTTVSREAVQSANGVWVATLPGSATSGRTSSGLWITASGVDENGAAVTGYILGVADFAIYALGTAPAPAPGGTSYAMHYFESLPSAAKEGDVALDGGVLKLYNGSAWVPFTDLSDYYTKEETDAQIDKLAAYYITYNAAGAAFPTRADLVNAQTYYSGGVARVPTRNDYAVVLADEQHGGAEWRYIYAVADGQTTGQWEAQYPIETNDYTALSNKPQINGVELSGNKTAAQFGVASTADATLTSPYWTIDGGSPGYPDLTIKWSDVAGHVGWTPYSEYYGGTCGEAKGDASSTELSWTSGVDISEEVGSITATRSDAYQLGAQADKPLASEAEAEALRTAVAAKQDSLSAQQLANIAAVPAKANDAAIAPEFDATASYAVDDIVMYNGARYKCTAAHSGAWVAADFTAEDVQTAIEAGGGGSAGGIPADAHYVYVNSQGQICYNPDQTGGGGGQYPSGTSLSFAIAPEFSTSLTYAVGAVVMYAGLRYICTTAVSTAGEWTGSTNWTEQTVQDVIGDVESALNIINNGAQS